MREPPELSIEADTPRPKKASLAKKRRWLLPRRPDEAPTGERAVPRG